MRPEEYEVLFDFGDGFGKPKRALLNFVEAFHGHPVVGPGRLVVPANPGSDATDPFLVFGALCLSPFTTITLPGANGSLLTLGLARNHPINVKMFEVGYLWNWHHEGRPTLAYGP